MSYLISLEFAGQIGHYYTKKMVDTHLLFSLQLGQCKTPEFPQTAQNGHQNLKKFEIFGAILGRLKGGIPVRNVHFLQNKDPPLWFSFFAKNESQGGGLWLQNGVKFE